MSDAVDVPLCVGDSRDVAAMNVEQTEVLVVGAGRIARLLPEAYRAVRSIEHVSVWARSRDRAQTLVAELRQEMN